jgi:purine catabolism regulator
MSFGWDLSRRRAVLSASIDPPETGPVPASALPVIAAAARATLGRDAIVWMRSATIAALIAPATEDPAERRAIAEGLRRELDERVRSVTISIGVGRRVDSPSELPRSYLEANRAVDVGRWAKGRHVTEVYDEFGLERLLAATPPKISPSSCNGPSANLSPMTASTTRTSSKRSPCSWRPATWPKQLAASRSTTTR